MSDMFQLGVGLMVGNVTDWIFVGGFSILWDSSIVGFLACSSKSVLILSSIMTVD